LRVRINIYVVRELCDTSDYAIDIVLGQRIKKTKTSYIIYYDSRTLNNVQRNYFTIEKELLGCVCFLQSGFREIIFQTFLCLFAIRKVGQRKTLSSQKKIWLGFQESILLENLGRKHFPEVVKNLEMSLFADYIKFDPQTFDCYI